MASGAFVSCEIVKGKGPSRDELFDSLKLDKTVTFTVMIEGHQVELSAKIRQIEMEDGSLHSWCIAGFSLPAVRYLSGHYRSHDRTGVLNLPRHEAK